MSDNVRKQLNLPDPAQFDMDEEGNVHIVSVFGDAWCQDEYDEETGDYASPEMEGFLIDPPETINDVCVNCRRMAAEED